MKKLVIEDLNFRYQRRAKNVIQHLNFNLMGGTFNVLYGPSGCGKSTLMKLMAGLYPEYAGHLISGKVMIDGTNLADLNTSQLAQRVAILFQNPYEQFSMKTVKREFIFTLENLGIPKTAMPIAIDTALQKVGILPLKERDLASLSGGELQKVSLAITLAMQSDLIVLDEPFANVDNKSRQQLLHLLKALQVNEHKTILIADHDLTSYPALIDHLYHFEKGALSEVRMPKQVFDQYRVYNQPFHFKLPLDDSPIMALHHLHLENGGSTLLNDVSLPIFKGKLILLTGENGTGKSTLFAAMTRLHPFHGLMTYQEKDVTTYRPKKFAKEVALVFQDAQMQYLKLTVKEELDLSLKQTRFPEYWSAERVDTFLKKLQLSGFDDHIIYQLSGGQKKKLQLLEMLILGTPVLLMDEPLAGLDLDSIQEICHLLKTVATYQKQTLIMISHQFAGLQPYVDYHLRLANQQLTYTEDLDDESIG